MKSSVRGLLLGVLGATALTLSPWALSSAQAIDDTEITLGQERVQVIHSSASDSDQTNMNFTFTNFGEGDCDGGEDDAIASGVEVSLLGESCGKYTYDCEHYEDCPSTSSFPFDYFINPFVAHTVNHQSYGTFFGQNPVDVGPGTVSARIVKTGTPVDGCGTWTLNLEATGLDLSSITANPVSLWLNDEDDSGPFCFDINNAVIGTPPLQVTPIVRRGVRR